MRRTWLVAVLFFASAACSNASDRVQPTPLPDDPVDDRFTWSGSEHPPMPTERTEVAVASDGEARVFVAGGFTGDGDASPAFEVFDASDARWSAGPDLPVALHHASLVFCGSIYLVGGYTEDGRPSPDFYSLAPAGEASWQERAPMPTARGAAAAACVDGKIHVVGGATSFLARAETTDAHEVYDPGSGSWKKAQPLPEGRDHLAAASDGAKLYVAGGRKLTLTSNSARFDIYDPARDEWSSGPEMPTARGGLAAAVVRDGSSSYVVVVGGEETEGTFANAEVFDVGPSSWLSAPDLPTARHGLGAATLGDDRLYVVGGGKQPGLSVTGTVELLTFVPAP